MQDYSLPRTDDTPLEFRGELIVSQDFMDECDLYLDQAGQVRAGKNVWTATFSLYHTEDGRYVYHAHGRTMPPVKPDYAVGKFETLKEHKKSLAAMEQLRHSPALKAGPLRFATS
ncbi:hypothetical protein [Solidesulfovibrio sp.]